MDCRCFQFGQAEHFDVREELIHLFDVLYQGSCLNSLPDDKF